MSLDSSVVKCVFLYLLERIAFACMHIAACSLVEVVQSLVSAVVPFFEVFVIEGTRVFRYTRECLLFHEIKLELKRYFLHFVIERVGDTAFVAWQYHCTFGMGSSESQ
jgi:hypothetical protein